jgi:predicted AAA+ superfamily ATPase
MLDGSVAAATVYCYATSNRRHLLPEVHDRKPDLYPTPRTAKFIPVKWWRKKISLSDGSTGSSFYPFSQDRYLTITAQWLASFGVTAEAIAKARLGAGVERRTRLAQWPRVVARDYAGRQVDA